MPGTGQTVRSFGLEWFHAKVIQYKGLSVPQAADEMTELQRSARSSKANVAVDEDGVGWTCSGAWGS